MTEHAVVFQCEAQHLVGIVHKPEQPLNTGVIILVAGGPQYRVGANRQFITLARRLEKQGFPVIRFDHRGMGDSGGEFLGFTDMEADIHAAINQLFQEYPGMKNVAIWGECESASAAAFYAHKDPRVAGIFMVNPWIRTESGQARTYIKHYYWNRLRDPRFWKKIRSGEFSFLTSIKSFFNLFSSATNTSATRKSGTKISHGEDISALPLPLYLTKSLERFNGAILILTSGFDYIAQEFRDFIASSPDWKTANINDKARFIAMEDADHTFSRNVWREEMFHHTEEWLMSECSDKNEP